MIAEYHFKRQTVGDKLNVSLVQYSLGLQSSLEDTERRRILREREPDRHGEDFLTTFLFFFQTFLSHPEMACTGQATAGASTPVKIKIIIFLTLKFSLYGDSRAKIISKGDVHLNWVF